MTELEAVPGVGPGTARKLREAFITTAELLSVQNPVELQALTNLGEGTSTKLVRSARKLVGGFGFRSALDVEKEMESKPRLSTGSEKLNTVLLGGLETGSIIELYGPYRSGKTQWCATLAVMAQMPAEQGGLEGRVLWLDTESAFKPWVIRGMAHRRGLDPDVVLGNIGLANIVVSEQISDLFASIPRMCAEEDYKLVIVDSFTGLFRSEYGSLDTLRIRQFELNKLLGRMRRAGVATDATFVITNQVMAKIAVVGGHPSAPVGGHILSHGTDYRLYLRKGLKDKRKVTLVDNAGIPEFDIEMTLGWGGFYDSSIEKKKLEPTIIEYLESSGFSTSTALKDMESEAAAE